MHARDEARTIRNQESIVVWLTRKEKRRLELTKGSQKTRTAGVALVFSPGSHLTANNSDTINDNKLEQRPVKRKRQPSAAPTTTVRGWLE